MPNTANRLTNFTESIIRDMTLVDDSLRDNYSMTFYEAGYMMFIHLPSLGKLKEDLAKFIHRALLG